MENCKIVQIEFRGFFVNLKYLYLGVSIDGFVICEDCGIGLIEVKCLYGFGRSEVFWWYMLFKEYGKDVNFFCIESNGELFFKEYYNNMY